VRLRGLAGACAAALAALVAGGCGATGLPDGGDETRGKELFADKCGSCHELADAGTKGQIGPNLDNAFRQARADGLGERTIETVVRGQIAYAVEEPSTGSPGMPRDLVEGDDADAVAAYVASVAALPARSGGGGGTTTGGGGSGGGTASGEDVFASAGCASCHTLAAAGASGTVGPNLDQAKPDEELVVDRVTNGQGAMPSFSDSLDEQQIQAVADYVSGAAGS
jgi:cbb3-type cytochrome c oxidase subunit III